MDYKKIYNSLMSKRQQIPYKEGYHEKHHIIPRSIGGTNESDNIVCLTAREHFIAHLLLSKMFIEGSINWIKMQKALLLMFSESIDQIRYTPSRWYAHCRERIAMANSFNQSGKGNSQYGKCWIYHNILKQSKSIHREDLAQYLCEGWQVGRIIKWDKLINIKKERNTKSKVNHTNIHKLSKEEQTKKYTEWYQIYNQYGWEKFCQITGYSKSKPNLVTRFKMHVPEFKPQNGKKRGKN